MIYGIIPVGGKGTRLSIPFDKEMMPLVGYGEYYPICQFTVDKLIDAGCDSIYFIHGKDLKKSICEKYNKSIFTHINNNGLRQSEIFLSFTNNVNIKEGDTYLYGLPDTIYNGENPFIRIQQTNGIVCGMFEVPDYSNVGRISKNNNLFIKSAWTENTGKHCWGVLKIDYKSMVGIKETLISNKEYEMEDVINCLDFNLNFFDKYWDLGTWQSLNEYYSFKYKS